MKIIDNISGRFWPGLVRNLAEDIPLWLLIGLYAAAGASLAATQGVPFDQVFETYEHKWLVAFVFILPSLSFLIGCWRIFHRLDARRRLAFRHMFASERLARYAAGLVLMVALLVLETTFTTVKIAMSAHTSFFADPALIAIDRALFLGHDPWRFFHWLAPFRWERLAIQFSYGFCWFLFCYSMMFWVGTSLRARSIRLRYMVTLVVVFCVLGNVVAFAGLSVGPALYGDLTGDTQRFAGLVASLQPDVHLNYSARLFQNYLWYEYSHHELGFGTGISAFPSIHVALVTFNALFLREFGRRIGRLAFAYVAFVWASSVYLGWHYAVDGIAAFVMTIVIYRATMALFERRPGMHYLQAALGRAQAAMGRAG